MADIDISNDMLLVQSYTLVDGSGNLIAPLLTDVDLLRNILSKLEEIRVLLDTMAPDITQ